MTGGTHTATGSAVAVSTLFTQENFRQIDVKANPGNSAVFYLGPSTVTSAGANAYIALGADGSWGARADAGDRLAVDLDTLYVVGTASDLVHFVVV